MKPFWMSWFTARRRKYYIPLAFGLLITLMFYGANLTKPAAIEQMGNLLFDSYQRAAPRPYDENVPVRIIDIDDESLRQFGQWPWPRTQMAELNDRLNQAGAGVIAYDIIFSETDRTSPENILNVLEGNPNASGNLSGLKLLKNHDQIFAESFSRSKAVLGFFLVPEATETLPLTRRGMGTGGTDPKEYIINYKGAIAPLPILEAEASGIGFVSFKPKGDGIIRRAPLISRIDSRYFSSLSIEALRAVQDASAIVMRASTGTGELGAGGSKNFGLARLKVGNFEVPTTSEGEINIYFTLPKPQRYIPAWKILSDDIPMSEWAPLIEGHIVFVGTGAQGLKDIVATPIEAREPGVLVHAQIVEQILAQEFLTRPYWAEIIENGALLVFGILLSLLLPRLGVRVGALTSFLLGLLVVYGSWVAFKNYQFLLNPIYPLLAFIVSYTVITLSSYYLTEVERSRVRDAFSLYLSPTMVRKVSDDPSLLKLGGEERNMTVLFLDIRGFSKISEDMNGPENVTNFLNSFLTPMTDILQDGKATIDKYMGDAIVAFWNAPLDDDEHEKNAARATLVMLTKLDELNEKHGGKDTVNWPQDRVVKIGIGLNTGMCLVGNLGSDQRFAYSMIGDAANLASRIEGLTKQYGVSTLIGESTANALDGFAVIEADKVKVVGRAGVERIFILLGDETMVQTAAFISFGKAHSQFLEAYRNRDWSGAKKLSLKLEETAKDFCCEGYYDYMRHRIEGYMKLPPPKDWDGSHIAESK